MKKVKNQSEKKMNKIQKHFKIVKDSIRKIWNNVKKGVVWAIKCDPASKLAMIITAAWMPIYTIYFVIKMCVKGIWHVLKAVWQGIKQVWQFVIAVLGLLWACMCFVGKVIKIMPRYIWYEIKFIKYQLINIRKKWPIGLATCIMVLINIVVYFLVSPVYGDFILDAEAWVGSSQILQAFLSCFAHGGLGHITYNMLLLIPCMLIVERKMGPLQMILVYLLTGIGGSLIAVHMYGPHFGIGSSTAVFGFVPVVVFLLTNGFTRLVLVGAFTALCMESAQWWMAQFDGVSHAGHLGGMMVGFIYASCVVVGLKQKYKRDKE